MSRKSSNLFTSVPRQKVSRNLFDLSHEVKMSGKFGYLYPVLCMDCLPGDVVRDQMTCFMRVAPLLAPVLHRFDVTTHFFFVPNRLLTDAWSDFITGGQDGTEAPVLPYITPAGLTAAEGNQDEMIKGTLWDYLGLPANENIGIGSSTEQISVLPFRAYAKIWNDWYRDPNLDDEIDYGVALEGNVSASAEPYMHLKQRGWEKDYFTSALPWAQRGAEVLMPLAGSGSVTYKPVSDVFDAAGGFPTTGGPVGANNTGSFLIDQGLGTVEQGRIENIDEVQIENSSVTINDWRRAMAIQKWLENNARGGGRYVEQIEAHFNVRVPDFRLQRAEYLGGGKQPVQISEVLKTAYDISGPVGDLKGHGISVGKSNRFTYFCPEHGFVIGILSVMPRTAYSQGIHRMWSRKSKYDYAWTELAHLGEQEILTKEVFYSPAAGDDDDNNLVFGYIPRYAEYKFMNDRIAGDFRTTLGYWHDARNFVVRPVLDSNFTTMLENGGGDGDDYEEDFRRIFAVQDETDYLWFQLFHKLTAKRPLPYFGVPSI